MVISKASVAAKKGHVTRAVNECNDITSKDEIDLIKLELAIQNLKEKLSKYQNLYDEYETQELGKRSETDFQAELDSHSTYESDTVNQLSKFVHILEGKKQNPPDQTRSTKPKLPTLELVSFGGDLLEWVPFWDCYKSLVDDRTDLDDVEKMSYLRSCLKGAALDLISGYQTSRASYADAIKALKENYADENRVKQHLCHLLLDLKAPSYNLKELTTYLNEYQSIIRNLKQYVTNVDQSNWLLQEMLLRKLPSQVESLLFTKLNKHYFTLDEVEQGIKDSIQHLMKVKDKQGTQVAQAVGERKVKYSVKPPFISKPQLISTAQPSKPTPHVGTVGSYQVASKGEKKSNYDCLFCQGQHYACDCGKYATLTEKRDRLKELNRCSRCISQKHETKDCETILLTCRKCKRGKHHTALCLKKSSNAQNSETNTQEGLTAQQFILSVKTEKYNKSTVLPTATVEICNGKTNEKVVTRAFFDQGSQITLINKNLASKLNLGKHNTVKIALSGFLQSQEHEDYAIVRPTVRLGNRVKRLETVVKDNLPSTIIVPGLQETVARLKQAGVTLADKQLKGDKIDGIEIIIGADYYGEFVVNLTKENNIQLMQCSGGYMIYGKIPHETEDAQLVQNIFVARMCTQVSPINITDVIEEATEPVHKLWDLDTIGINPNKPAPDDKLAYQTYLDTLSYEDNQYWVRLPWKLNCPALPTNYNMALGQLKSLTTTLKAQNDLKTYHELILAQLDNDFIERVDKAIPDEQCHYLPHHAVKKDSATTPLRIVFNCSAKRKGNSSLNDCLMKGPSLTEKLGEILLRFRTKRYAYSADISKAFLRVGLQEIDRDFTRFLWYENPEQENAEIITYRFKSVLFGATCSPFLLQATLDNHFQKSNNQYKDILRHGFYVDNFIGTTNSQNELIELYHNANSELMKANMPLRMWVSNNPDLNKIIEQDYPEYEVPSTTQILGLHWEVGKDKMHVKPLVFVDHSSLSKRMLLSLISSVFDPLGFLTPITIKGKLLLREAWKLKIGWDEPLPSFFVETWNRLQREYERLGEVEVPRKIVEGDKLNNLHVFCDASTAAYGAVAYLVSEQKGSLVTSKARVAPLKTRTLPQLELTALQVGVHLARNLHENLKVNIENTYIWSDNEAALQWVRNDSSKIPYVRNRVADIRESASHFYFQHVPGKVNPSDFLSRGVPWDTFIECQEWLTGPSWLCTPENWTIQKEEIVSVHTTRVEQVEQLPTMLFDATQFSSLDKILNITNNVFKCLKIMKPSLVLPSAIVYWLRIVQQLYYKNEYEELETGSRKSDSRTSLIKNLGLYIDPKTKLIHCYGRLHNTDLSSRSKFPVLLPRHSWMTTLLVRKYHNQCLHGGVADTLAAIREQYWIPQGRQVIKSLLRGCIICKTIEGKALKLPGPPPLPKDRVVFLEPFRTVGIDYSGPITITKTESNLPKKFYVCLFTCAVTRAVHLELAKDLSAITFSHLFRRFVARRSSPKVIISDNATNFTATSKFLKELYDDPMVQSHIQNKGIEWKFLPPGAPWMGGFYERMIGVVKNCLRKVLFKRKVSEDELITVLSEIEMRINNRPLTYIDDDINHPTALTPSHLICGRRLNPLPSDYNDYSDVSEDPDYLDSSEINNRYSYLSKLLRHWEKVWKREYLASLREKFYGAQASDQNVNFKVGDVVLIENDGPRATWPLGRITAIHTDKEDKVRMVEVFSRGNSRIRTLEKLIPLELHCPLRESRVTDEVPPDPRPRRQAAQRAERAIRDIITANMVYTL